MKITRTYSKLYRIAAALVILIAVIAAALWANVCAPVTSYADTSSYTDVLTDLKSDSSFSVSDYPANSSDYSLSVIQIAESEDSELFIYVYQPYTGSTYDLTATSINISTTVGDDNVSYKNYSLTLLSSSGTLHKYKVNNFTVKSSTVRYYDISSIYRTYYTKIDGAETGDNTTSELAIAVAQCWAAGELNGETYYDMEETTVVTINAYAGFIRYWTGSPFSYFTSTNNYIDSHYIAFDCDYDIDELYEADISFYLQDITYVHTQGLLTDKENYTYGDIDSTYYDTPLTISSGEEVSIDGAGILGIFYKTSYSWDRICTVTDFITDLEEDDCDYDSDFVDTISDMQWVIRFYETDFSYSYSDNESGTSYTTIEYTQVTDITILRLKFLSEGQPYNLGVVCNKITGSSTPSGTVSGYNKDWKDKLKTIVAIIMIVLLLVIFAPVLPYVVKVIVWIISLPFKLISAIINLFKKKE